MVSESIFFFVWCAFFFFFYLSFCQAVSKNIRDALSRRAADFGIVMEDTAITHLSFSREYTAAVEAKQVFFVRCAGADLAMGQ